MCSRWYVTIKGLVRVFKVCLKVYPFPWCYKLEATVLQSRFYFTAFFLYSVCSLESNDIYLFIYLFICSSYIYMAIYFQFYLSISNFL